MKLQTMRRLDSAVGIPAVYVLKGLHRLAGFVGRARRDPVDVREILLIKCFGMGSLLLARPFLSRVRATFPNARVQLLTFSDNRALAELLPEVDRVHYIQTGGLGAFAQSVLSCLLCLRRGRIDISFDQEFFSKFTTFCSLVVAAPWRVGFYLQAPWRERAYTHDAYFSARQHVSTVFLAQLGYALAAPHDVHLDLGETSPEATSRALPPLRIPEEAHRRAREVVAALPPGRLVAVNVNAGELSHLRRWPREFFERFLRRALEMEGSSRFLLVGGPGDVDHVRPLAQALAESGRVHDLCGVLTIPESLALFGLTDLMISNDSGPLHLAAVMGTDTMGLFGPETPTLYGPIGNGHHQVFYRGIYCSPCLNVYNNKTSACRNNICMTGLPVESVVQGYERWLARQDRPPRRQREA